MWSLFAIDTKLLLYDDANVDFRDANVLMSQKLMNRKLNKNGANHLAPGMVSGRKYRKEEVIRKNIRVGWIRGCFWTS